jgi:hypothetical protein
MSDTGVQAVPEGSIVLHVGMHKTGTTALQGVLYTLRDELPALGLWYPDPGDPTTGVAHHMAARSLLQQPAGWGEEPPDPAVWDELVALAKSPPALRTILTSEHFSGADDAACERIAADLGADRLHVIIGVRNFASIAVSLWQQTLKRRRVSTLDDWLERNFRRPDGAAGSTKFWDRHDPSIVAERWVRVLGPDRVSVLMLDEDDRELVPRTFEELLALPSGTLTSVPAMKSNRGMTGVEAELVRLLNVEFKQQRLRWDIYRSIVRIGAVGHIIEHRQPPASELRPQAPGWVVEQAVAEAQRVADALTSAGVRVIGDLANLQPRPAAGPAHSEPLTQVPSDLAVDALVGAAVLASRRPRTRSQPKRGITPSAKKSLFSRLRARLRRG